MPALALVRPTLPGQELAQAQLVPEPLAALEPLEERELLVALVLELAQALQAVPLEAQVQAQQEQPPSPHQLHPPVAQAAQE